MTYLVGLDSNSIKQYLHWTGNRAVYRRQPRYAATDAQCLFGYVTRNRGFSEIDPCSWHHRDLHGSCRRHCLAWALGSGDEKVILQSQWTSLIFVHVSSIAILRHSLHGLGEGRGDNCVENNLSLASDGEITSPPINSKQKRSRSKSTTKSVDRSENWK